MSDMRLIDANELLSIIERRISDYSRDSNTGAQRMAACYMELKQLVESRKTIYDKDEITEKLLEERSNLLNCNDYENDIINFCLGWFDNAIAIVTKEGD